jgi:hypothetical protein
MAVAFSSCSSKDDEPANVSKNEVAGDYVIATASYLLNADGSITLTDEADDWLNIDLAKVTVSGNTITAKDSDGDLIFQSTNVVEASNGVVWNLAVDSEVISAMKELGYDVAGFGKYLLEGKKYHAFYDAKDKGFDFSLVFIADNEETPDIVLEFAGTKK